MIKAVHSGDVLANKFEGFGVLPTELARQLHVPENRITQIIEGKHGITGGSALRLAQWFCDTPDFWMNLHTQNDLYVATSEAG